MLDVFLETDFLRSRRQLAMPQQVGHLEEVALFGQLLDRITPIEEFALVAVDERDLRPATRRRQVAGIIGEMTGLAQQGTNVDAIIAVGRRHDWKFDGRLPLDGQSCFTFSRH
jgi:hypothetical protein